MPVLALREGLGRISSDTALEKAVNQRGMESTEIDIEADAVTVVDSGSSQKCKSKRLDDPESGGLSSPLEWNWSRWAGEDVKSSALVPALITQALATG
jgi:hypothetical protein